MRYSPTLALPWLLCGAPSALACNPLPPAVTDAVLQHQMVMVGEYHGTNEAPQAFYDLVCTALAAKPQAITVALELNAIKGITLTDKNSLQQWLTADKEWLGPHDGRSSKAMYQLLEKLVEARQTYPQLSILLFNSHADARDEAMAQNIMADYHGQKLLTYSGDTHAKQTSGTAWDANATLMGQVLKQHYPAQIYSIKLRYAGGTAWAWEDTIGVQKVSVTREPAPFTSQISANADVNLLWNIGPVTASYPYLATAAEQQNSVSH